LKDGGIRPRAQRQRCDRGKGKPWIRSKQ
jgi:hypothetical protein